MAVVVADESVLLTKTNLAMVAEEAVVVMAGVVADTHLLLVLSSVYVRLFVEACM